MLDAFYSLPWVYLSFKFWICTLTHSSFDRILPFKELIVLKNLNFTFSVDFLSVRVEKDWWCRGRDSLLRTRNRDRRGRIDLEWNRSESSRRSRDRRLTLTNSADLISIISFATLCKWKTLYSLTCLLCIAFV
jgi:hypothetical protein